MPSAAVIVAPVPAAAVIAAAPAIKSWRHDDAAAPPIAVRHASAVDVTVVSISAAAGARVIPESVWYGAGVGIAAAEPASIVETAAIEAQEATRITVLRLKSLSSFQKTAGSSVLFQRRAKPTNPRRLCGAAGL
jgi:hypothetical protein